MRDYGSHAGPADRYALNTPDKRTPGHAPSVHAYPWHAPHATAYGVLSRNAHGGEPHSARGRHEWGASTMTIERIDRDAYTVGGPFPTTEYLYNWSGVYAMRDQRLDGRFWVLGAGESPRYQTGVTPMTENYLGTGTRSALSTLRLTTRHSCSKRVEWTANSNVGEGTTRLAVRVKR